MIFNLIRSEYYRIIYDSFDFQWILLLVLHNYQYWIILDISLYWVVQKKMGHLNDFNLKLMLCLIGSRYKHNLKSIWKPNLGRNFWHFSNFPFPLEFSTTSRGLNLIFFSLSWQMKMLFFSEISLPDLMFL